jgi:exopolysaccharide production protein ExoQ
MIFTFERLVVALILLYMSNAFSALIVPGANVPWGSTRSDVGLALQPIVYLPVGILILKYWHRFVRGLPDCKWAIALTGLALISGMWAADPLFTFRKALILTATTAFGIYFGTRFRRDEQINLLCYALGSAAVMSLVVILFLPQYGIDHNYHSGNWRGVFEEKNVLGKVTVLAALVFCMSSRRSLKHKGILVAWLGVFGTLIVFSGSKTAAVAGAVLLFLAVAYGMLRYRVTLLVPFLAVSVLMCTFLIVTVTGYQGTLLAKLGRDPTLSGRSLLWDSVLVAIGKRPVLGYGFNSFWNGMAGPSATVVEAVEWVTPHAHNGFLDLCLDLGVVGLLMFSVGFVLRARTAIMEYRFSGRRTAMWPLVYLSFIVIYNITESSLLHANGLYWVLYTAALVRESSLSGVQDRRMQGQRGPFGGAERSWR